MCVVLHLHIEGVLFKRALAGEGWGAEGKKKKKKMRLQSKVKRLTEGQEGQRKAAAFFWTPVSTVGSPDDLFSLAWSDSGEFHSPGTLAHQPRFWSIKNIFTFLHASCILFVCFFWIFFFFFWAFLYIFGTLVSKWPVKPKLLPPLDTSCDYVEKRTMGTLLKDPLAFCVHFVSVCVCVCECMCACMGD